MTEVTPTALPSILISPRILPNVVIPDTWILLVLILSVAATPVNADPSPLKLVAVITPVTLIPLPSIVVALPTVAIPDI